MVASDMEKSLPVPISYANIIFLITDLGPLGGILFPAHRILAAQKSRRDDMTIWRLLRSGEPLPQHQREGLGRKSSHALPRSLDTIWRFPGPSSTSDP